MVDVSAEQGWLATTLRLQLLLQMISQARWLTDSPLTTLPHIEAHKLHLFRHHKELSLLPSLMTMPYNRLADALGQEMEGDQIDQVGYDMCYSFSCLKTFFDSTSLNLPTDIKTEHFLKIHRYTGTVNYSCHILFSIYVLILLIRVNGETLHSKTAHKIIK